MADTSSCGSLSISSIPARSSDPAWQYGIAVEGNRSTIMCVFCNKTIRGGGITCLKYHLAGIEGNVEACKKVSDEVKWQMKELINSLNKKQEQRKRLRNEIGGSSGAFVNDREEPVMDFPSTLGGTSNLNARSSCQSGSKAKLQSFLPPGTTQEAQPGSRSALATKESVHNATMAVARWWFDANIPFNAAKSNYYQPMVDAITSIGPGFKAPSYHDLRCNLLREVVHDVNVYLSGIKKEWEVYGCSIMADGWSNQRQEPIINFLMYCPKGTMFLKSIDTSGLRKDKDTLLDIFDQVVHEVGVENVVQFITDNDASYEAAGKALQQRYETFFWSPCAAHCIDLMLENISDARYFPLVDETIKKARKITKFIYNHAWVLSLMRKDFTNGRDLCRPGITRFATHFLSLQCLLKYKKELCQMFTCDKWVGSNYAKGSVGKEITAIILQDKEFWVQCQHIMKVTEPLVRVLRLVDSEEKPAMGYLFEAMEKAKEAIKVRLRNKITQYGPYIRVIDAIWDKQLHSPLHAAGCFLNPAIYFNPTFTKQNQVARGFLTTLTRLVSDDDVQDKISAQLEEYKASTGDFGLSIAIRQREKLNPVAWWRLFGNGTLELQKFAIRVLSQCCSATGCERNWSVFEFIHSKKLNRLEHKRLNDLVFVRYNLKLRERNLSKTKSFLDPISLDNIDLLEDWISEEPSLLDGEDLSWEMVDAPFASLSLDDDEEALIFNDEDDNEGDDVIAPI